MAIHRRPPMAGVIGTAVRAGAIAACPDGHAFRATLLRGGGARWVAFYAKGAGAVFVDDYVDGLTDSADYELPARLARLSGEISASPGDFRFGDPPCCPQCGAALPFAAGLDPPSVLWIEGQVVIDGVTGLATRLTRVTVSPETTRSIVSD